MPDRRVPRGSYIDTPGGENTDYPLNDGGVSDYREEQEELKRLADEAERRAGNAGTPRRLASGGFGVKPITNHKSATRRDSFMSRVEQFITLSFADVLDFISGDSVLTELLTHVNNQEESFYNPPTKEEFGKMLSLAITRESGKLETTDVASAEERAAGRAMVSPAGAKEYADGQNMAFPVNNPTRAKSAHAYIHKYWNEPSQKGITATYGREDFIRVHKKIVAVMKKMGIEHNYMDSLDDASGFKKEPEEGRGNDVGSDVKNAAEVCMSNEDRHHGLFHFYEGQTVVSLARSRMREKGTIVKIDGLVATVQWESSGLAMPELLAGLIPST